MRTIHKYQLGVNAGVIDLPPGYKVIAVHEQRSVPTLWIELDSEKTKLAELKYCVLATGELVPDDYVHLGTVFIGSFVWHVYQRA